MTERVQPEIVDSHGVPLRRLADPEHLRALAHPRRMDLIDLLATDGPLTATECAERLGDSPASCSYHLRQLARFGMVEEAEGGTGRQRPWRWVPLGNRVESSNRIEASDRPAEQAAIAEFIGVVDERNAQRVRTWRAEGDGDPWHDAADSSDWMLRLTEDELTGLAEGIQELIAPYARRFMAGEHPEGSRVVDVLTYLLPRPAHDA